jgi:hypothetical protein
VDVAVVRVDVPVYRIPRILNAIRNVGIVCRARQEIQWGWGLRDGDRCRKRCLADLYVGAVSASGFLQHDEFGRGVGVGGGAGAGLGVVGGVCAPFEKDEGSEEGEGCAEDEAEALLDLENGCDMVFGVLTLLWRCLLWHRCSSCCQIARKMLRRERRMLVL